MRALRIFASIGAVAASAAAVFSAWLLARVDESAAFMARVRSAGIPEAQALNPDAWKMQAGTTFTVVLCLSVIAAACSFSLFPPRRWARTGFVSALLGFVLVAAYWAVVGGTAEFLQLVVFAAATAFAWWVLFRSSSVAPLFTSAA